VRRSDANPPVIGADVRDALARVQAGTGGDLPDAMLRELLFQRLARIALRDGLRLVSVTDRGRETIRRHG
jgi:hypothetical protein